MTPGQNTDQVLLRETARRALESMFPEDHARRLLGGADPERRWSELAGLGWFGIAVPEQFGGAGLGLMDQVVILEEMGRVLGPGAYAATSCGAIPVLVALATAPQRERWLTPLLSGERQAALVAGPDAGGIVARPAGDGYALSGVAGPVPGAAGASTLVVAATTAGAETVVCCIDSGAHGVSVLPVRGLDATAELGRLDFTGAVVAAEDVLGAGRGAVGVVADALNRLTIAAAAELCGAGERMLEMAVEYARVREQFGRPIGSFQAIKHMCADMMVRLESSRATVEHAAASVADGRAGAGAAVSVAKAFAAENIGLLAEDALQVHGGIGFTWEHAIHLYVRRAASVARLFGSADAHRERVAVAIGL